MNCPSCNLNLVAKNEFGIEVDVCLNGCGGVWFDASELEKVDDAHENITMTTLFAGKNQNSVVVDRSKARSCPRCNSVKLDRICEYKDYDLEIDSCKTCNGVWLDPGELNTLREINQDAQKREKVFGDFSKQATSSSRVKSVLGLLFK